MEHISRVLYNEEISNIYTRIMLDIHGYHCQVCTNWQMQNIFRKKMQIKGNDKIKRKTPQPLIAYYYKK